MKLTKLTMYAVSVIFLSSLTGTAFGEERFGVPVYPGAKQDASTTKGCPGGKSVCFRISDDFSKVYDFYQNQKNLDPPKFYQTMPASMKSNKLKGPKKAYDFCKKGSSELCGLAELPLVRIMSPWTVKHNISPAAPLDQLENKDVFIMITEN